MNKEDLYKYYRKKTKDEIIEELYYKCNTNYDLVKRIDKAIKHIEKYGDEIVYLYDMSEVRLNELLEILRGNKK